MAETKTDIKTAFGPYVSKNILLEFLKDIGCNDDLEDECDIVRNFDYACLSDTNK